MKHFSTLTLAVSLLLSCSNQSSSAPPSSGGAGGRGGSAGSGGKSTTGGSSDTGGAFATGGTSMSTSMSMTGGTRDSSAAGSSGAGGSGAGGTASHGVSGSGGVGTGGSTASDASTADAPAPDRADDLSPADAAPETGSDTTQAPDTNVYNPCPTSGGPCKVLPFGDSITMGVGDESNAGYRAPLFALAVAARQKMTFTGSQSNGPTTVSGQPFPQNHEGHSGWTIDPGYGSWGAGGISSLVPTPAFTTLPDIVLLMIGTNDVYASSGQSTMTNRLAALLDKILSTAPDALLVVAKITPLTTGGGYRDIIKTYNDAIPGLVQTRAAAGKHIVVVDMNSNFNTQTMLNSDGIHPNTNGYKFMANQWYAAIGSLLPK
jgi:hypothetical protein